MEELSLDQIKKKSELEENIDFEKGDFDLECCEIIVTLNVNSCSNLSFFISL